MYLILGTVSLSTTGIMTLKPERKRKVGGGALMSRGNVFQAEGVTSTKALKWEKGLDSPVKQQVWGLVDECGPCR